jgi:geranylgeranyl diphosphate synthase type II
MLSIDNYREAFIGYLNKKIFTKEPKGLYDPMVYILGLGGKRLRPVLTLMAADIFESDYKNALDAALAVEVFHNFSLVHEDRMDHATLRRCNHTLHEQWNLHTGILSGDAMLFVAYQHYENYNVETFQNLAKLFSKTAIEVCEGQQYDVDFETRHNVTIAEYIKMITYKTAVLVGASLKMGAIVANATSDNAKAIYDFGLNLGIAFQLKDDYLDVFGDPATFGKQTGGDIIVNKKTFLYLKALENLNTEDKKHLLQLYATNSENSENKIKLVKEYMLSSGADNLTLKEIENYTQKAFLILKALNISNDKKETLRSFGESLMGRMV